MAAAPKRAAKLPRRATANPGADAWAAALHRQALVLDEWARYGHTPMHGYGGILEPEGAERYSWDGIKPGATVAQVAAWMDAGTRTIPARPFFTRAMFEFGETLASTTQSAMEGWRRTPAQLTEYLAHRMARLIHRQLQTAEQWAVPLAASTIAAKGHSTPLHDTQSLATSVGWTVQIGQSTSHRLV